MVEAEKHLQERAVRAYDAYAAQQRIEDGINAILAHLGHSEVAGKGNVPATEQNPATPPKRRGIESLIPSGKPSKKSSAKSA